MPKRDDSVAREMGRNLAQLRRALAKAESRLVKDREYVDTLKRAIGFQDFHLEREERRGRRR